VDWWSEPPLIYSYDVAGLYERLPLRSTFLRLATCGAHDREDVVYRAIRESAGDCDSSENCHPGLVGVLPRTSDLSQDENRPVADHLD
jgi:hypothetical protein